MTKQFEYEEEGAVSQTISAMIALFVGLGVVILVVILVGTLGGKAFNTVQADIVVNEADGNLSVISQDINASIVNAFSGFGDGVGFLSIIILALVFFLVLALLGTGMRPFSGGGAGAI